MSSDRNTLRPRATSTFLSQGKRPGQEDFLLLDSEKSIFVVADGFGGPIPGAAVAKSACQAVREFLFKEAGDLEATLPFVLKSYFSLAGNVLFNSLIHANRKVTAYNKDKGIHEKGGASVLAGFIDGDLLAIAHVGLCSASLIRSGKLVSLVVPRSMGRLCDPFSQERNEFLQFPLMALGTASDLEPEIVEYRVRPGDWLLFHTDGISQDLGDQVADIQQKRLTIEQSLKEFTALMKGASYEDNAAISLAIL